MSWMVYLIVLAEKLYWMMITFENMMMVVNLATRLAMRAELVLINTGTPVMKKVTA